MRPGRHLLLLLVTVPTFMLAGCGDGGAEASDRPTVVVSTSILGDVVKNLVDGAADVTVVMPAGADPHNFSPSARQVNDIRSADALIVNGAGFEAGLDDAIEAARDDGVSVHRAIDAVDTLPLTGDDTVDPHFFTDPARMADAAEGIAEFLAHEVPGLDTPAVADAADAYVAELRELDAATDEVLSVVPEAKRVLVTNHDVFEYLADRYGFEVVGVVIPGGGTIASSSGRVLDELVSVIEAEDVPAIFADTSSPTVLADALADEVGDVEVVELFSESLGKPGSAADTYVGMISTNARRIARALR